MVLATVSDAGEPVATPLFYVCGSGWSLYWLSSPDSRHSRNLGVHPRVAVTIFAEVSDWREIRGVQMEGVAAEVRDAGERAMILDAYRRRFALRSDLDAAIARTSMYVFQPEWVRYVDNSRGFGFREEMRLPGAWPAAEPNCVTEP
jgi:uncharacterized protein YhbP (UPF0306 family)